MKSEYYIAKNHKDIVKLVKACKKTKYCSFDYETNGESLYNDSFVATLLSVTFQPGSGIAIPLNHFETPIYCDKGYDWKRELIYFGRQILEDPEIVKIAWNLKFDDQINKKFGIYLQGTLLDGMLCKYLLNEERPNGLKEMVELYLPEFGGYQKENNLDKLPWDKKPLEPLAKYGCMDTDCTFRLTMFFEKRLMDLDMYYILRNLYMPASRVLTDVEINGLYMDRKFNEELLKTYKPKIDKTRETVYNLPVVKKYQKKYTQDRIQAYIESIERELDKLDPRNPKDSRKIKSREEKISRVMAGEYTTKTEQELTRQINLNSNTDLPKLMYSEEGLNLPIIKYTKDKHNRDTDKPSTDEETLTELRLKFEDPESTEAIFLDNLLELRALEKMYKVYILGWSEKVQDDSCLHGKFNLIGTTSNRLSSSEPNLQQVPKTSVDPNIKKQLVSRPGTLYLVMDFSQCIDGDSYIFCDTGIKKLKEVIPGKDRICLVDPQWVNHSRILDINCLANKGRAECLRITTNTGRELILTLEHPVKTVKGYTKAQDLKIGDTLFIESFGYSKRCGNNHISSDEAYIAGLFYGDGHYPYEKSGTRKPGDRSIAFATGMDREFLKPLLEKFFECQFNNPNKPTQGILGYSDKVLEFKDKYPKIDSHHMSIPEIILEADWESKMHFIAGQIDSDGSIGNGRFRYTSVCYEYIHQLQLLFQSVGFHGIIREGVNKLNGKEFKSYHLIVQSTKAIYRLIKYLRLPRKIQDARECLVNKRKASNPANKSSHCPTQRIPLEIYRDLPYPPSFYKTYKNSLRKGRLVHSTLGKYIDELIELDSRWSDAYWYKFEYIKSIESVGEREVYDLEVDKLHEFNPNGIRVHNCELRMMAHLAKDETYLRAFAEGKDPHLAIAAQKYDIPYEEVLIPYEDENHPDHKLWKIRRKQAKQIAFGLIYGIQKKLLAQKLSDVKSGLIVTPDEAEKMRNEFFEQHPSIERFMKKQERVLKKQGYITSLFGTRRRLPQIFSKDEAEAAYAIRLAVNFPCQSPASNMTLFGSILNYWDMRQGKFPYMMEVATVHDAVYYNTDPKNINVWVIWKMWETFRNPQTKKYFGFQIDDVDMSMDFSIGRTMAEELPFIPGYDYSKMLEPNFSVEEYMEEAKQYKHLDIKDYPKHFKKEMDKIGKQYER